MAPYWPCSTDESADHVRSDSASTICLCIRPVPCISVPQAAELLCNLQGLQPHRNVCERERGREREREREREGLSERDGERHHWE